MCINKQCDLNKVRFVCCLPLLMALTLQACSDDSEQAGNVKITKLSLQSGNKTVNVEQKNTQENHWLVDSAGNLKHEIATIDRKLDDQEVNVLDNSRKVIETEAKNLIQELDENLDHPEIRKEIKERLRETTSSSGYKQKALLLAKDKLKQEKQSGFE